MRLHREWLEKLIFGTETARRFTQDSPVLPDVWIAFGEGYTQDPAFSLDLLLTPHRDVTAGQLARALRRRLAAERTLRGEPAVADVAAVDEGLEEDDADHAGTDESAWWAEFHAATPTPATSVRRKRTVASKRGRGASAALRAGGGTTAAEPAYNQSTVVVRLRFPEMIRVLLPLSGWWQRKVFPHAGVARPTDVQSASKREHIAHATAQAEHSRAPASAQPDLLWFYTLVGVILRARAMPQPRTNASYHAALEKLDRNLREDHRKNVDAVAELLEHPLPEEASDFRPLYLVSRNRDATPTIARSTLAVKADAARRLFELSCAQLAWAVMDSGIDATHPAFRMRQPEGKLDGTPVAEEYGRGVSRVVGTFDFTRVRALLSDDVEAARQRLADVNERIERVKEQEDSATAEALSHEQSQWESLAQRKGETYVRLTPVRRAVAAGRPIDWSLLRPMLEIPHTEASYRKPRHDHGTHVAGVLAANWRTTDVGVPVPEEELVGVCPDIRLYDFRILDENGKGDEFGVMAALQFLRFLNAQREQALIHGVNLSLSIRHDVANYACGRTPVCEECERVVATGVVVVAAAGNDGYAQYTSSRATGAPQVVMDGYRSISISDPGNADGVITVGATHRYQPHTYGVSYFSSRGPTGDGRNKPDLVAPGEKIVAPVLEAGWRAKDGTSMAAPHVSGAAALLMARYRELVGRPQRIKSILCETATDLGRERYFQGHGMVDVLRALQSV